MRISDWSSDVCSSDLYFHNAAEILTGLGASDLQAAVAITRQMVQQAYLLAANDLFWFSAWLSLAMIPLIWFSRRTYGGGGAVETAWERSQSLGSIAPRSQFLFLAERRVTAPGQGTSC